MDKIKVTFSSVSHGRKFEAFGREMEKVAERRGRCTDSIQEFIFRLNDLVLVDAPIELSDDFGDLLIPDWGNIYLYPWNQNP
jgi:hypothetical protein